MHKNSGYYHLLKNNAALRNLWYGQVVSELGDWLNSIAIYALILQLGGSGIALACTMMAKLLPFVFVSPIAGVMTDRICRKKIMIASDVLRFFTVLGLLWVDHKGDLWLLYTLVAMEIALSAFFEPARSAIIPSITQKEDLVTANALGGATWSVMLALGSALGGGLVSLCGIRTAFVVDALSFLLSAAFIARIPYPADAQKSNGAPVAAQGGFKDMQEGFQYLRDQPVVLGIALLKSGLAIAGGIMTLIPLYSQQMFSSPSAVSFAIGAMYSSRGVGATLGPLLVKHLFGDSRKILQTAISASFVFEAAAYLMFSASHSLWTASLSLFFSTLFGSIIWVFSTTLLHLEAENRFLGRIFSSELALMTLVMGISNLGAGVAVDQFGLTPNQVMFWMGLIFFIPSLLWALFCLSVQKREDRERQKITGDTVPLLTLSAKEQERILDQLPIK